MVREPAGSLEQRLAEEVLPLVGKPSRYLGTELNSVHKDPARTTLRAVLAFPDSYDLGLGNLGLQILYGILNSRPEIWCERVCAPHGDLEQVLRAKGLPLFSLESKRPLHAFDLVGFTLQWELTYTNLLNMLDLGGIPVLASERGDEHPIVVAGGPCSHNPEPLALFIDAFVIGDGEEVVLEVADAVAARGGREAVLDRLAALPGVYVPSRFPEPVLVGDWLTPAPGAPRVTKRVVRDLDAAPFQARQIVPFAEQIHDRVSIEVLRGCTHGCRFCQAGMVTRPVRERSLPTLARLQTEAMAATGYEEVSLVSLSTCDHSRARSLARQAVELATPDHITVSLPSLRLDSYSVDLSAQVGSARKSGLTFAPEAATDRLRAVINKPIGDEELLATADACYRRGFESIKLYFMIGLPTETDEDVLAIGDLATRVFRLGQSLNRRAKVNLGVSTFVPKPWTPFQWAAQIGGEETIRRQRLLRGVLPKAVKFGRHDAMASHLEGLIGRLDRRGGWLLYWAWQEGCRMDGWTELLDGDAWDRAIGRWESEFGVTVAQAQGERDLAQPLPWDHLDVLVDRDWLVNDWHRALAGECERDCRQEGCHRCGVIGAEPKACATMLATSRDGVAAEAELPSTRPPRWTEPDPIGKIRFRWRREGLARLTSHHEVLNVFIRAMRRAGVPMRYSEGFHPHASLSFVTALRVGMETEGDWCDVIVTEAMSPNEFVTKVDAELPEGFGITRAWAVPMETPALMATYKAARYVAHVPLDLAGDVPDSRAAELLAGDEVIVSRRGKDRDRIVFRPLNIRSMIRSLSMTTASDGSKMIAMELVPDAQDRLPKADEVVAALFRLDAEALARVGFRKLASYLVRGDSLEEPQPPTGGLVGGGS
ncbi:MAG: TIGR03960 family B12-binding radical SAM protein [Armatimonadetes bacterium]|nr:TIGR03960 family B12-binding radical SAM protein [Armatimonadota bacterium]